MACLVISVTRWHNRFQLQTRILPQASGVAWRPASPTRRDACPPALESYNTSGLAAPGTLRLGGFSRLTASNHTGRGLSSSGLLKPRFQGWSITTQGGSQQ